MMTLIKKTAFRGTSNGFTLIEFLLSLGLLTILMGIALPVYQGLQNKNDLSIATNVTIQGLRRAQALSRAVSGDANWGLKIQSGSVTVFKGTSYAARDADFDEIFETSSLIVPTGTTEIVFSKLYGFPSTAGTITLTSQNDVRTVEIYSSGTINNA